MNKAELIDEITTRVGLPKKDAAAFLDTLGGVVSDKLAEGEEVTLPGLGKLRTSERAAREGRNPKTGETIQVPAKWVVKFSAGKALEDAINA